MDRIENRDYYFDNAKMGLILLVVVGHVIEPIIGRTVLLKSIYFYIYLFHMPCFILISGYFTKKTNTYKIGKLFISYLVFQTLFYFMHIYILGNRDAVMVFTTPYWVLWFLISTISWRLITPHFIKLKHPIIISIIIAALVGYETSVGYYLSLSRTIVFFPFYLMGYFTDKSFFENICKMRNKLLSIIFIIFMFAIVYYYSQYLDVRWLYNSVPYNQLGVFKWYKAVYRLIIICIGYMLSILFMILVPARKLWFTSMGQRTMQAFLLHGFIVKLMVLKDVYKYFTTFNEILALIFIGVTITIILLSKPVEIMAKFILNPKFNFLYINISK